jgi:hypothetical protein
MERIRINQPDSARSLRTRQLSTTSPVHNQPSPTAYIQRAIEDPTAETLTPDIVMHLQSTYGNHFVQQLVTRAQQKSAGQTTPLQRQSCGCHESVEDDSKTAPIQRQPAPIQPKLTDSDAVATRLLQRTASWANGTIINNYNLAQKFANYDFDMGYTPPTLNGTEITSQALARNNINSPVVQTNQRPNGQYEAWFSADANNTASYNMYLPTAPPWQDNPTKLAIYGLLTQADPGRDNCNAGGNTNFRFRGLPNDNTFLRNLTRHERHHASDNKRLYKSILRSWHRSIWWRWKIGKRYRGASAAAATNALWNAVGGTPDDIADELADRWDQASDAFHNTNAGRKPDLNTIQAAANGNCSQSYIRIRHP